MRKNPNLGLYHQEPALQKEQHFLQQLSSQDVASVDLSEHSNSPKEAAVWKRCANGIGINQFLVNMTSTSGIHPSAKEPLEISLFPGISLCFGHPLMGNVLTNGPLAALCQEPKFDGSNEQRSSDCKNYCRPGWWVRSGRKAARDL